MGKKKNAGLSSFLGIFLFTVGLILFSNVIAQCPDYMPISPSTIPQGTVGTYYSVQFSASGGTPPYTFYTEVCPPGFSLTSGGLFSGVPLESGEWSLYIWVEDSSSPYPCSSSADYILKIVEPCPLIYIYPTQLPEAKIGTNYDVQLSAQGGTQPYLFYFRGGKLPKGLSLSSDGKIYGTPSETGTFNFLIVTEDAKNCEGSASYTLVVNCETNYGSLSGYVAISGDGGQSLYILDGDSVSGTMTATSSSGDVFTSEIERGAFSFENIPAGNYTLSGQITYKDNILYDAKLLEYGCSAPSNSSLIKTTMLPGKNVEVKCDSSNLANYLINPPLVMIHGSYDCYNKWFSESFAEESSLPYFDNYARQIGFISFTPNYDWWNGSYLSMAEEVLDQIGKNFSGLSKSGAPPFYVIAHDTGGLLLRVLGSQIYKSDPVVGKIRKAFLLGTPNSGANYDFKFGSRKETGENLITRYFNEVYPDFGKINVFPVAGNKGWWGSQNDDGMVSLDSVFSIKNVSCIEDDCVTYPAVKFQYNMSQILPFSHKELGDPESVYDVFNLILSNSEKGTPEAPVGAVGWGTTGVTSKKIGGQTGSFVVESSADYPFYVSKCDGIAILIKVSSGAATFKFVDPNGIETLIENGLFLKSAPAQGNCFLRVLPESGDVTFEAVIIENSLFGIKSYLTSQNFLPGESVTLRVDKTGDWSLVSSAEVSASMYDASGSLLQTISLVEKGNYYTGSFVAPSTVGNYPIIVEASGLYNNSQFTRTEIEAMNVVSASHLFTGDFSDFASDKNGDGKFDSITFNYSVNVNKSGFYSVSADIYDSLGNFVAHSTDSFSVSASQVFRSSLVFDLSSIHCEQLSGKFFVVGLKFLDGDSLNTLDVWNEPIETKSYSSSQFECDSSPLTPSPSNITPVKVTKGTTAFVAISGNNFKENAVAQFESPLNVLESKRFSDRVVFASISIPESSASGYYDVYVKNPDGKIGKIENGLYVSDDTPPVIAFAEPQAESEVGGVVNVVARTEDDIKVVSVSFELDGTLQKRVDSYPFIWAWETSKTSEGRHTLKITATDSSGQSAFVEESVNVVRFPEVLSLSKKSDPFRIVVSGNNFKNGIEVYINNEKWNNVLFKTSNKIVLKGGASLKTKVPKGVKTTFRFVNPDGGETTYVWQR